MRQKGRRFPMPPEAKSVHHPPKMWICVGNVMGVTSPCTKDTPKEDRNPAHLECGWTRGVPHGS